MMPRAWFGADPEGGRKVLGKKVVKRRRKGSGLSPRTDEGAKYIG